MEINNNNNNNINSNNDFRDRAAINFINLFGTNEEKSKLAGQLYNDIDKKTQKYNTIPNKIEEKINNLQKATILKMYDADTFRLQDEQGNIYNFRINTGYNTEYDAIDDKQTILNNPYKQKTQIPFLEKQFNKSFENITDEEIQNLKNYQSQIAYLNYATKFDDNNNLYIDNKEISNNFYSLDPNQTFDPNKTYNFNPEWFKGLEVNLENLGDNVYGRKSGKLYNLNNNNYNTLNLSNNLNQNANFNLNNIYEAYIEANKQINPSKTIKESLKTRFSNLPNRALASIDRTLYGLYSLTKKMDIPTTYLVDAFQSKLTRDEKSTYEYFYNNPEVIDLFIPLNAGVSINNIQNYNNTMSDISNDFNNGNILEAIGKGITVIPELLADSMGDIALMAATGGVSGLATKGASTLAKQMVARTVANNTVTASQLGLLMDDYAKNNNGNKMSNNDILYAFMGLYLANSADILAIDKGSRLFFQKTFGKAFVETALKEKDSVKKNLLKDIIVRNPSIATGAFIGESVQENIQGTIYEYFSQNQKDAKTLLEIATSNEQLLEGLLGGLVGGSLAFTGSTLNTTFKPLFNKTKQVKEKIKDTINTTTEETLTEDNNKDLVQINDLLSELNEDLGSNRLEEIKSTIQELDKKYTENISPTIQSQLSKLVYKGILKYNLNKGKDISKLINDTDFNPEKIQDPEELLLKLYYYSDKNNQKEQELIEDLAKENNIDINEFKSYNDVDLEAKFGDRGYFTYETLLKNYNKALSNPDLNETDKLKLEQDKEKIKNNLNYFLDSQFEKLERISNGINAFTTDDYAKEKEIEFSQKQYDDKTRETGFIRKSDILNYDLNSNKGIFKIINVTNNNISDMLKISKEQLDLDTTENIKKLDIINKNIIDSTNLIRTKNNKELIKDIPSYQKKKQRKKDTKTEDNRSFNEKYNEAKTIYEQDKLRQEYIKESNLDDLKTYLSNVFNENILIPLKVKDINIDLENNKNNIKNSVDTEISKLYAYNLSYMLDIVKSLPNIVKLTSTTTKKLYYINLDRKISRKELLDKLEKLIDNFNKINTEEELKQFISNKDMKEVFDTIRTFLDTKAKYYNNEYYNQNSEVPKTYSDYYRKIYSKINSNIGIINDIVNKSIKENKSLKELYKEYQPKSIGKKIINKFLKHNTVTKNKQIQTTKNKKEKEIQTNIITKDENKKEKESIETKSIENTEQKTEQIFKKFEQQNNKNETENIEQKINENIEEKQIQENQIDNKLDISKPITLHSGGADGSDTYWGEIGKQYGIQANHYRYGNMKNGNKTITEKDAKEGKEKAAIAAKQLYDYQYKYVKSPLLIRNWSQVKYSDVIIAIGTMLSIGDKLNDNPSDTRKALIKQVKGGTGYAVQMAINEGKPVYVYDQVRKEWYKNITGEWKKSDIPTITNNFAGIGTRNLNEDGKKAIRDVYEKSFGNKINNETKKVEKIENKIENETTNIVNKLTKSIDEINDELMSDSNNYIEEYDTNNYSNNNNYNNKYKNKKQEIPTEEEEINNITDDNVILYSQQETEQQISKLYDVNDVKIEPELITIYEKEIKDKKKSKNKTIIHAIIEKINYSVNMNKIVKNNDSILINHNKMVIEEDEEGNPVKSVFNNFTPYITKKLKKVKPFQRSKLKLENFINDKNNNAFKFFNGLERLSEENISILEDVINFYINENIKLISEQEKLLKEKNLDIDINHTKLIKDLKTEKNKILNIKYTLEKILKRHETYENKVKDLENYKGSKENKDIKLQEHKDTLKEKINNILEKNINKNNKEDYDKILNEYNIKYSNKDSIIKGIENLENRIKEYEDTISKNYETFYEEKNKIKKDIYKINKKINQAKFNLENEVSINNLLKNTITNKNIDIRKESNNENIQSIANKIKTSNRDKSLFGMFEINKEHAEVKEIINNILNTVSLNGKTNFIRKRLEKEPALALLFKNIPNTDYLSKEKVIENLDTNVAVAIDYSIAKLFTIHRNTLKFDKEKIEKVKNPSEKELYERAEAVSQLIVINKLGDIITETLGITYNKETSTESDWLALKRNLGLYALHYAVNMGYLSIDTYRITETKSVKNNKKYNEITEIKDYIVVKDITNMYDIDFLKAKYELLGLGRIVDKKQISTKPIKNETVDIARKFTGQEATTLQEVAHENLRNTPFKFIKDAVNLVIENIEVVKDYLGYTRNLEEIPIAEIRAEKEGLNLTIDMSLQSLIDITQDENYADNEYYFDTFAAKNSRIHINSDTINPQSDKIHRFLIVPHDKEQLTSYKLNTNYDKGKFAYALGQAFGIKVDKMSSNQILELFYKLTKLSHQDILNKFINKEEFYFDNVDLKLEIEEVTHFLQGIIALRDYETMVSLGKTELDTMLILETDSTTSGVFLKLLQLCFTETYKDEMEQVGIFQDKNMTINDRKSDSNNLDIYESVAKNSKKLSILNEEELANELENTYKYLDIDKFNDKTIIKENIKVYNYFKNLLPEIDNEGKVSKALRNIFKNPIMTFFYMISGKTLINNVSNTIRVDLFSEYSNAIKKLELNEELNDREKLVVESINKFLSDIEIKYIVGFKSDKDIKEIPIIDLLKDYKFKDIYIYSNAHGTISLSDYFTETVGYIYGGNIYNTLSEKYGALRGSNVLIGLVNNIIIDYINTKLDIDKTKDMTISELENYIKNEIVYPAIKIPFSNNKFQGIVSLNKNEVNTDKNNVAIYLSKDNVMSNLIKAQKENTNKDDLAILGVSIGNYEYDGSSVALPAVLTHSIDSAVISLVMSKYKVNTVHDAIVRPANMVSDVSFEYNKSAYEVSMEYNSFRACKDLLDSMKSQYLDKSMYIPMSSVLFIEDLLKTIEVNNYIKDNKFYKVVVNNFMKKEKKSELSYNELYNLISLMADITDYQKSIFKTKDITISNMDGLDTSKYNIRDNKDKATIVSEVKKKAEELLLENTIINTDNEGNEKITLTKKGKKIDPDILKYFNDTTTEEDNNLIESRLLDNGEERVKIFDELAEKTGFKDNPFSEELRNLLSNLNSLRLKDLVLEIVNNIDDQYDVTQNKIIMSKYENSPQSRYSNSAVRYTHEIIHAVTAFALDNADKLGITDYKNKILYLYQLASQHIKPEDFLPETIINKEEDMKEAIRIYNYIFKNQDKDYPLRGVNEFIAYALTDERLANKLKEIEVKLNNRKRSIKDILKEFFKNIIKLITPSKNRTIEEVFPNFYNILIGNTGIKDKNVYDSLYNLVQRIIIADNKALNDNNSLAEGLKGVIEGVKRYVYEPLNTTLSKIIKNTITMGDKVFNINDEVINIVNNSESKTGALLKIIGKVIAYSLISSKARKVLPNILSMYGIGSIGEIFRGWGVAGRWINEVRGDDEQGKLLQEFGFRARSIDRLSKELRKIYKGSLEENFKDDNRPNGLNDTENVALTDVLLKNNLQSLNMDINEIKQLLVDDNLINKYLKDKEEIIRKYSKTKEQFNYYMNSLTLLVDYMNTGNLNSLTVLTAKEIADRAGTQYRFKADKELEKAISEYATLSALKNTNFNARKLVSSFNSNGLDYFIKAHKSYIEGSNYEINADTYQGRSIGYTKTISNNPYDIRIGLLSDKELMENKGYKLFSDKPVGSIGNDKLVLYKGGYKYEEHRNGATFMYTGYSKIGIGLYDYLNADKELSIEKNNVKSRANEFRKYVENDRVKKSKLLENKIYSLEELHQMNKNNNGIATIFDENGDIADYSFVIPKDLKQEIGINEKGIDIISEMQASLFRQQQSIEHNKKVFDLLKSMNEGYMLGSTIDDKNNYKWVAVDKYSNDRFMIDVYNNTDKQIKQLLYDYKIGNDYKPLLVREDLVLDIFGQKDISLANKLPKNINPNIRKVLDLTERIIKFIATNYKGLIVIKTPIVLLGNIMSNIGMALLQGINPLRIIDGYRKHLRNLQKYIKDEKRRTYLLVKQSTVGLTKEEESELGIILIKLKENPVHPLMTRGLMQNIIDDVDTELDNTSGFDVKLENLKNKLPKPIRYTLDIAFMTKNTFMYQSLNKATQYSDFLARTVEYEFKMEKAKQKYSGDRLKQEEDKIIDDIRENYINYDKPHSSVEQYLNDMGLLLFTKFFKRIQSVIVKFSVDKPINTALFLLSQLLLIDIPDIFETALPLKDPTTYINDPISNLSSILIPPVVNSLK